MLILPYRFPIYAVIHGAFISNSYATYLSDVTLIMGSVQLFVLYLLCRPLSRYRAAVIIGSALLFYATYFIPWITRFLELAPLQSARFILPTLICIVLLLMIQMFLMRKKINWIKLGILSLLLIFLVSFSFLKLSQLQDKAFSNSDQQIQNLSKNWNETQSKK